HDRASTYTVTTQSLHGTHKTRRPETKLAGYRREIVLASGGRHPFVEGVALCVHCERYVRLTANGVDPGTEPVEHASGFSIAQSLSDGGIDIWCDPQLGVRGLPGSRSVDESNRRCRPGRGEPGRKPFADRAGLERTYLDAADGHAGVRKVR